MHFVRESRVVKKSPLPPCVCVNRQKYMVLKPGHLAVSLDSNNPMYPMTCNNNNFFPRGHCKVCFED